MSTLATSFGDSAVMLRRNAKHTLRNPVALFNAVLFPLVMMLMFVYVFGGAFKVQGKYVDYAVPGLLVMAIGYGLGPTAAAVNGDMTKGIINRFKAMDVSHGAVLAGHVVSTTVRALIADAAIIGLGFAMGFRPHASALDWFGAIGLMLLLSFALSWLTVAMGLAARTVESAGMATVPLIMLPFLSSAFVPADTMGAGVRQFAEYQPFTPVIETLRGLLTGHPDTGHLVVALAWCVGFAVVGYLWAVSTFRKRA
ncbi:ABC transporter permease [Streptacidiphilus jiangxiensis]|uniref:Transport permease protein n=1 Tax=Streptacidiphilus jiangxiensis TaxID=235985 RepID=A0A1H7V3C5_STRJI|nr:ABC transporter permease [Streptacidiphilus jiangxiensis]SEM03666.1 ABC-2 type transport system permease protein [Streptacidiphilus jiangxiensis]